MAAIETAAVLRRGLSGLRWVLSVALVLLTAVVACAEGGGRAERDGARVLSVVSDVGVREVPGSPRSFWGVVWPTESLLVVTESPPRRLEGINKRVASIAVTSGEVTPLKLPVTPACSDPRERPVYGHLAVLADGRVLVVQGCNGSLDSEDSVLAFEPSVAENVDVDVLVPAVEPILGTTTWDVEDNRGMTGNYSHLCGSIALLDREGLRMTGIRMGEGDQSWSLDTHFVGSGPCTDEGLAKEPIYSPRGDEILFLAAPGAVGLEGVRRTAVPWNLYRMDPDALEPEVILADLALPLGLGISPDAEWLVFSLESSNDKLGKGTWVMNRESGDLFKVSDTPRACEWSPTGEALVCLDQVSHNYPTNYRSRILIVEVHAAIARARDAAD